MTVPVEVGELRAGETLRRKEYDLDVTAVARAGLHIEFLHEFPFLDWPVPFAEKREGVWQLRQQQKGEIPLSFSLRATKPA